MYGITPNMWYSLDNVFGPKLLILDRSWTKQEDPRVRVLSASFDTVSTSFKDSRFEMEINWEELSTQQLTKTDEGQEIHYLCDSPVWGDVVSVHASQDSSSLRTNKFTPLQFFIDPASEEDITKGVNGESYRYKLLLKSERGVYTARTSVVRADPYDPSPMIRFDEWYPPNLQDLVVVHVPLDSRKVKNLEIMLEENLEFKSTPH